MIAIIPVGKVTVKLRGFRISPRRRAQRHLTHLDKLPHWELFLPGGNLCDGSIGFVEATIRGRAAEIGYQLTRKQGHGYAREAVKAVIVYLHTHFKDCEISARVNPTNYRSIRLLNALGFARGLTGDDGLIEFRLKTEGIAA